MAVAGPRCGEGRYNNAQALKAVKNVAGVELWTRAVYGMYISILEAQAEAQAMSPSKAGGGAKR